MDGLSKGELRLLLEHTNGPCVTIYMPTHDAGADIAQDAIRFKNLLRLAEERLREHGLKKEQVDDLVTPGKSLMDLDRIFWRGPKASFVLFLAKNFSKYHHLPLKIDENVYVDSRFHLKPMLRMLSSNGRFYTLALSQDEVRLLQGTRYGVRQVALQGQPRSLHEFTSLVESERQLQMHSARSAPGGDGVRTGIFHGHGPGTDGNDDKKERLREFFRETDKAIVSAISDDSAPLVLAAVEYLQPIYREVNNYPHLLETGVIGNPELLSSEQLHGQAWPMARTYLESAEREAIAKFQNLTGTNRSSIDLREILTGAYAGRVETVFVSGGNQIWGRYDPDTEEVTLHDEAGAQRTDLLDLAATQTFLTGGRVFVVDPAAVPGGEGAAAVFRF